MHVVTFYSFKGGVGRTQALVNVGAALARSGRRVLLVDFDLEAPGIESFQGLEVPANQRGLVDYISDYVKNGVPSCVNTFVYQVSLPPGASGHLAVMPAGERCRDYGTRLSNINWRHLYEDEEGYLFMEDLKAQWQELLQPDYVLVDSRTGHTEVGGICTRQLADTVVFLFTPNEQNLHGLKTVVDAVRKEGHSVERRKINEEFVASNVPDLDDEEEILKSLLRRFAKTLNFRGYSTIHRYDSLQLLTQPIFTFERPKSRLSRQYLKLLGKITSHNLDDRVAAVAALKGRFQFDDIPVADIVRRYPDDAEILYLAGSCFRRQGKISEARTLLEKATEKAKSEGRTVPPHYLLELAETQISNRLPDSAKSSLNAILWMNDVGPIEIQRLLELWRQVDSDVLPLDPDLPAIRLCSDEDIARITSTMNISRAWQEIACRLLLSREIRLPTIALHDACLAFIGTGAFDMAMKVFDGSNHAPIQSLFNHAMARWGSEGTPSIEEFTRVVKRDTGVPSGDTSANYEQCIALSLSIIGDVVQAKQRLQNARQLAAEQPLRIFSCWSYLDVAQSDFVRDLEEMKVFIEGGDVLPRFFKGQEGTR